MMREVSLGRRCVHFSSVEFQETDKERTEFYSSHHVFTSLFHKIIDFLSFEEAFGALDALDHPDKLYLISLRAQKYRWPRGEFSTTEKLVNMLREKGYLYHASVLIARVSIDFPVESKRLIERNRHAVAKLLEGDPACEWEKKCVTEDSWSIDNLIKLLSHKKRWDAVMAFLPLEQSLSLWDKAEIVKKLCGRCHVLEAKSILPSIQVEFIKSYAQSLVVGGIVRMGDTPTAVTLASQITDPSYSKEAYLSIFNFLLKNYRVEDAISLLKKIEGSKIVYVAFIAETLLDSERLDDAIDLLKLYSNKWDDYSESILAKLSEALLKAGRLGEIRVITALVNDQKKQASMRFPLVENLLKTGNEEEVESWILTSENEGFKNKCRVLWIQYLLEESQWKKVMFLLSKITKLSAWSEGMFYILQKCVETGALDTALRLCSKFSERKRVYSVLYPAYQDLQARLIEEGRLHDAQALVFLVADRQLKNFLAKPLLEKLLEKIEQVEKNIPLRQQQGSISQEILIEDTDQIEMFIHEALEILKDTESQRERIQYELSTNSFLNPLKIAIISRLIRHNTPTSLEEANILFKTVFDQDNGDIGEGKVNLFYALEPIIKAWTDVNNLEKAMNLLGICLQCTEGEDQEPFAQIIQKIIEIFENEKKFQKITEFDSLISDELLIEKIAPAFNRAAEARSGEFTQKIRELKNQDQLRKAVYQLKKHLKESTKDQRYLSEITMEIIDDLREIGRWGEIREICLSISDESLQRQVEEMVGKEIIVRDIGHLANAVVDQSICDALSNQQTHV